MVRGTSSTAIPTLSNLEWRGSTRRTPGSSSGSASFSRLIVIDRRGSGLSDRFRRARYLPSRSPSTIILAVLDARRLLDAALFAATGAAGRDARRGTHPERSRRSILLRRRPRSCRRRTTP